MSITQPPAIAIKTEDRQAWQQALIRGHEHGLGCVWRRTLPEHGIDVDFYLVESHTTAGKQHSVAIWTDAEGVVHTRCGCEAGWFGRICQHAALVVNRAGRWGDMPILAQQPLTVDAPALHVGSRVQIKRSGKRGTVSYVVLANGRDFLFSVTGLRDARLGVFLASELEPAQDDVAVAS